MELVIVIVVVLHVTKALLLAYSRFETLVIFCKHLPFHEVLRIHDMKQFSETKWFQEAAGSGNCTVTWLPGRVLELTSGSRVWYQQIYFIQALVDCYSCPTNKMQSLCACINFGNVTIATQPSVCRDHMIYTTLLEKYPNFFFEIMVDINEARLHEGRPSTCIRCVIFFFPPVNSVSWW